MRIYQLISFLLFLLFDSCISYDNAIIYKRKYFAGSNNNLRFQGFYLTDNPKNLYDTNKWIYPTFFYSDGSVILLGPYKDTTQLCEKLRTNNVNVWGYWGNYKIINDTIIIETFPPNGGTWRQERYLQKGIIYNNRIGLISSQSRNKSWEKSYEELNFFPNGIKPDSTENWIRHKKKYNR